MATNIVIKTDTPSFTPVFNRMPITVYENDVAIRNLDSFKYIIDLYIEGQSFGGLGYYRWAVIPEPVLEYGTVDLHSVCESFVSSTPVLIEYEGAPILGGAQADGSQSIIKYYYRVGYQYRAAGVLTNVPNLVTSADKYAWDASLDKVDLIDYFAGTPLFNCNVTNGANGQFLTDFKTNYVTLTDHGWNHIITDTPTDIDSLAVITYDSSNNVIQTVVKNITVGQTFTQSRNFRIATNPASLNAITGAFVSGAQPIVTSDVYRYEVLLVNSAGTVASETLNFYLQESCRYPNRHLWFLNRYGSFDCFNFQLRSQKSINVESKGYKMDKYRIVTAGLSYSRGDRENIISYNKIVDKMVLRTDYLETWQHDILKDLITSPEIYLQETSLNGTTYLRPVHRIKEESWIEKEISIDKLFIMEVELTFSDTNFRQRR